MDFRSLGIFAERVGQLASTAIEQGAPVAKKVAARIQTVAANARDELVAARERARQQLAEEAAANPAITHTPRPEVAPEAARVAPTETPVSVRVQNDAPFDLTGLSISAEDAREVARAPKDLEDTEAVRNYVASTPVGIFLASARVAPNADELKKRGVRDTSDTLWQTLKNASSALQEFDQANGTDYAASSWLAMMRKWDKKELFPANVDAADAAAIAMRLAAASPRPETHVADVCDCILAMSHIIGWPAVIFRNSVDVDTFLSMVKRAGERAEQRDEIAKKVWVTAGAIMASQQSEGELALRGVDPQALRVEIALGTCDALDALGATSHEGLRSAPELNVSESELRELERVPRWLLGADPSTKLSPAEVAELVCYLAETKGSAFAMEERLRSLRKSPRIAAMLDAKGLAPGGVAIAGNLVRGLRLLAAYDATNGSRHAVDVAKTLLAKASLDEKGRRLVEAAREVFAGPSATADDKLDFLRLAGDLIDTHAWPPVGDGPGKEQMEAIIRAVADKLRIETALTMELFMKGFKLVSAEVQHAPSGDRVGRAAVAGMIAAAAHLLERPGDADIFGSIQARLLSELNA